jgi:O-antigen/teichoic acid export membrane protein
MAKPEESAPVATPTGGDYVSGARVLAVGVGATGLLTFLYFSLSSHLLTATDYGELSVLWAALFIVISVIYRPIEQLLSRTISDRRARGAEGNHPLRGPMLIQTAFALTFLVVAIALRPQIEQLFGGSQSLYLIFVSATVAYAASYFARGYFAGHQWFVLYGGLMLFESSARVCFPLAVLIGITSGQTAIAIGIFAAPLASLLVVPWAIARHSRLDRDAPELEVASVAGSGVGFAGAVAAIQLGEQTLLNAGVLVADSVAGAATAGAVFSVLLITRAPLQLFQSIQTTLLPHLTGLEATKGGEEFSRAIKITVRAIAVFAGLSALVMLLLGPSLMELFFGDDTTFGRWGLAAVAIGMGFHLIAGTLNQAALARGRAKAASVIWLLVALAFVGWMFVPLVESALLRAELGYPAATATLCALLYILYRRPPRADGELVPARRSVEDVIEGSGGIILTEDRRAGDQPGSAGGDT